MLILKMSLIFLLTKNCDKIQRKQRRKPNQKLICYLSNFYFGTSSLFYPQPFNILWREIKLGHFQKQLNQSCLNELKTFFVGSMKAKKLLYTVDSGFLTVLQMTTFLKLCYFIFWNHFTYMSKSQGKLQIQINIYTVWISAWTGQFKKTEQKYF